MNTAMPQERLAEILDQVIREITQQAAGITLQPSQEALEGELCTVYITFDKGFHTSLSICAEAPLFLRLAQSMMMTEEITDQDVEAVAKEYFNVLCGHIAARLFSETKVSPRFSVPVFYRGRYVPEEHSKHIVLTYSSDKKRHAQMIQHLPLEEEAAVPEHRERGN